ncbi:MAG: hypothetical protein ACKOWG_06140 [Planctomycetia bacterium]
MHPWLPLPEAAPPVPRGTPRKFFDTLLGRQPEPEPAFIAAPTPPGPEEVKTLERMAAAARAAAKPADSAKPTETTSPDSPALGGGVAPVSQPPAAPIVSRPPTWDETVKFAASLEKTARKIAADASDPAYKPKATRQAVQVEKAAAKRTAAVSKTAPAASRSAAASGGGQSANSRPSGAAAPATPRFARLRSRIGQTLAAYQRRPLNTAQHTPWEVMHGFIAFGIPTKLRVGGPGGDPVNAIGWVNTGGRCGGQVMLAAVGDRLTALRGIGVQGHSAQYLAILAQCRVAMNSPITVQSKTFTVADLVAEEKLACKSGTELTFALIALAHYLPTDAEWTARDGKTWSLEKLVAEEIEQPIRGAPCGGTHRLFGLAYGCQRRLRATGQLDGVYLRADKFVRDYQQFTLTKLQNRDGSFSTEWFKYPADREDDIDRKIQTTGHILEWLVASLEQEELFQPRVTAAVEFLSAALAREPSRDWKIGPLGHALHALTIYQERAWGTVLPGGIAAFHGAMKADPTRVAADSQLAKQPAAEKPADAGSLRSSTRR